MANHLYKAMISYDKASGVPENISAKDAEKLYKSMRENQYKYNANQLNNQQLSQKKLRKAELAYNQKISNFFKVLRTVQTNVNGMVSGTGNSLHNLRFDPPKFNDKKLNTSLTTELTFMVNRKSGTTCGRVNMNLNVNELLKYPALELYTLVTASVINSVIDVKEKDKVQDVHNMSPTEALQVYAEARKNIAKEKNRKTAMKVLTRYIQIIADSEYNGILKGVSKHGMGTAHAEFIAKQILEGLSDKEIREIMYHNFNEVQSKDIESDIRHEIDLEVDDKILEARLGRLHEDKFVGDEKTASVGNVNIHEQYKAVANIKLGRSFDEFKKDIENGNHSSLQDFCNKYAQSLVDAENVSRKSLGKAALSNVNIKFVNNPNSNAMGEFHSAGNNQWIEINLAKVNGVVGLATTISHEMRHYLDAAGNKKEGIKGRYGNGLLNDMSEDISKSGLKEGSRAHDLLKEVNKYCYVVNPNERRARQNELASYEFLLEFAGNDKMMRQQIMESIEGRVNPKTGEKYGGFIQYQEKTIKHLKELGTNIEKFSAELANLGLSESSPGYKMIQERINYLKEINGIISSKENTAEKQELSYSVEEKAINEVRERMGMNRSKYNDESSNDKINEVLAEYGFETEKPKKSSKNQQKQQSQAEAEKLKKIQQEMENAMIEEEMYQQFGMTRN